MAAAARPMVGVRSGANGKDVVEQIALPSVFLAPIRADIVHATHKNMAKNHRQPYAVNRRAGMQHSAESWGTGRAVSRIPRVQGSGNRRSGQGAFGNMCRSGRMFAPTRVWRRWHRQTNLTQRRFAVCSAVAASAVPALVMARGHRIADVAEVPLVVSEDVSSIDKTSKAIALLQSLGAYADVEKVKESRQVRSTKGKMRNRRFVQRRGPLLVYAKDYGISRAFRNLPGLETACVDRLNLLELAPGGHVGRFVIWTRDAFAKLDSIFGTFTKDSEVKKGFSLPQHQMQMADLARIINSTEVQAKLRPAKAATKHVARKKNPLKNLRVMMKLNPYVTEVRGKAAPKADADKRSGAARAAQKRAFLALAAKE